MKITVYKNVDVEFECDVEIDDIIREFAERIDKAEADYWRRMLPAVDVMTRILAGVEDTTLKAVKDEHRTIIAERLATEADRWRPAP